MARLQLDWAQSLRRATESGLFAVCKARFSWEARKQRQHSPPLCAELKSYYRGLTIRGWFFTPSKIPDPRELDWAAVRVAS